VYGNGILWEDLFCIVVDLYALLMIILLQWQPGLMASWGGGEWERL